MKASVQDQIVAESDDIIEHGGYHYFPVSAVRMDWLEKTPQTEADLRCPHGVQFYDVVLGGKRYARAAWSYEAPRPALARIGGRFGFWEDVHVG